MFYRILAQHEYLGWLSSYNQVLPQHTWTSLFSRLYGQTVFDRIKNRYYFPKPFSAYNFWAEYLPDITRHDRPLTADDVPQDAIEPLRKKVASVIRYQNKPRFLTKVTGWARMAYFDRVFPEAIFIYLKRDPLAIVSSWVNAGWLNVTGELGTDNWEWGDVPQPYYQLYNELGGGPILSAAIKTQLDIDDLQLNATMYKDRCLILNYEDLVADPCHYLQQTLSFCDLPWSEDFEAAIARTNIQNLNHRWKKYLSEDDGYRVQLFFDQVSHLNSTLAGA